MYSITDIFNGSGVPMTGKPLDINLLRQAFRAIGRQLNWRTDVDILIVGGAAIAMTCGEVGHTTLDCDVMVYQPKKAGFAVEQAAQTIAPELGLPENWLNSQVQLRSDTLPDGWRDRRQPIGVYGQLRVFAASRLDLIAMKIVAGRPQDLQDLSRLDITTEDADFVRGYLQQLPEKGTPLDQIEEALDRLTALEPIN